MFNHYFGRVILCISNALGHGTPDFGIMYLIDSQINRLVQLLKLTFGKHNYFCKAFGPLWYISNKGVFCKSAYAGIHLYPLTTFFFLEFYIQGLHI